MSMGECHNGCGCITRHIASLWHGADPPLPCAVNPGFGGQKFIEYQVEKVRKLRQMCDDLGVAPWIEVDGGISGKNAYKVKRGELEFFVVAFRLKQTSV